MKKKYSILLTLLAGGILGYLYLNSASQNDSFQTETFTPKQMWDNQMMEKREKRENGEYKKAGKPNEYTKYFKAITTKFGEEENSYPMNYKANELKLAKANRKAMKAGTKFTPVWTERGPANVGGRTRGLIIDPDDATNNTWFAGSATGGIWKTTDRGLTWRSLTEDYPNLSANTIEMSESNHDIIYAGTGESFTGEVKGTGILKSTDRGENWIQLTSTSTDKNFKYANRLAIHPTDPDIVVVATQSGIMKTTDGGLNWIKVYSATSNRGVEDLRKDPSDFNTLYAAENSIGVLKSIDAGDNWIISSDGIGAGARIEIAVSPVNTNVIYASQEISSEEAYVYRSEDKGVTWFRFEDKNGDNANFLGQGWYDNTIAGHPYNEDIAFLGGVNLWKVDFDDPGTIIESDPAVIAAYTVNTGSFLSFVNFNGPYMGGGMEIGTNNQATDITEADFVSVEIRFGPGMTQKAHQFTVGGEGSGVAPSGYSYAGYVDVPFEVWDITNNKQLMASFRDQSENGIFDLVARDDSDPAVGREYLFVNLEDYSETASTNITKTAGHSYKQMYFFWPTLAQGGTWDAANLPDSKIYIEFGTISVKQGTTYVVSSAYDSENPNNYDQGAGLGGTKIPGLHPDHHNLVLVKTNEVAEEFIVVNANDGGLAISEDNGVVFNQLPNNYPTTQFYGAAKSPGNNEYMGGMQDNGTWRSKAGENASINSEYLFQIGGDGFECIWHATNPNKIIGSIYYNAFYSTSDGGANWTSAAAGITSNDGPFISRLSTHKNTPDNLYAVGGNGVYKSTNFGTSWAMKSIGTGWNGVNSQHNVEVSLANENIVWAGAAMATGAGWNIFVSTNQGENYNTVSDYAGGDLSGYISGIATHPTEDSTAFLLFSFAEETKVIRTKDLGETWEDLSGYNGNTVSSNGFPDVITHSLIVLPNDLSTIWVGTDIGIFESNDDGTTWHYADNGIPAVSIYDMFIQDGQVVVATHGRGIWTATIAELNFVPELSAVYEGFETADVNVTVIDAVDSIKIYVNDELSSLEETIVSGLNTFEVPISEDGINEIKVESFKDDITYYSNIVTVSVNFNPMIIISQVPFENRIKVTSAFTENYDSVQIFLNDNYYSTLNSPASGAFNEEVSLTESGTYKCYIYAYINGMAYKSNEKSISFTFTVGIDNINNVNTLKVYPNPTTGYISVELPENFDKNYNIDIYSLSGAKVYSSRINNSDNRINIENLKDGLYIIKLENNGEVYSQKIQLRK